MKAFDYAQPRTEAEVVELLLDRPGASEILAGGTDLVGLMKKMVVRPERVVNIMEVESLRRIAPQSDGSLAIGAAVHLDELLAVPYLENYAALLQAVRCMNSPQLQSQGTIGGDVCCRPQCWYFRNGHGLLAQQGRLPEQGAAEKHAIFGASGPARFVSGSRLAPALIALGAEVRIVGPGPEEETRRPLAELYRTPQRDDQRETSLEPRQFVSHVILPPVDGRTSSGHYEVRHGEGPDYPLLAAAACLQFSGSVVSAARIVLGQAAPTPWVAAEAAQALVGRTIDAAAAEAAGEAAVARATPLPGAEYKVHLARVAVKRSVLAAAGMNTGGF